MANSNLNEIIDTSLSRIKELANSQTVIGDPITLPNGVTIVPVCKVAIGYATGGLDFPAKGNAPTATKFGGGGGGGVKTNTPPKNNPNEKMQTYVARRTLEQLQERTSRD